MQGVSDLTIWAAILGLGVCTFLVRYSFIGLMGDRQFPDWAMRLLRYVPVTVLPAMVAPMVVWPKSLEGETDPARILAALVVLVMAALTRGMLGPIAAGLVALWLLHNAI